LTVRRRCQYTDTVIDALPIPKRDSLRVNDSVISYQRAGRGEPLLFLHGSASIAAWPRFLTELAQHHDVIVPDHPGFGESPSAPWLDNIHDVAYAYLGFISQLGLTNVNVVGHALGGWIACEIAIRCDRDFRSLTLVAPAGIRILGIRKLDTFLMSPEAVAEHSYVDFSDYVARAVPDNADEHAVEVYLRDQLTYARLAWQPRLFDPHLHKWLNRISVPTLLVWGEDDHVIPPAYADAFVSMIPRAKRAMITHAGHYPQIEQPAAFVQCLETFYQQLPVNAAEAGAR
jgi:pimeloyl-ACP methyl ester carboxylesterase